MHFSRLFFGCLGFGLGLGLEGAGLGLGLGLETTGLDYKTGEHPIKG